MKSLFSMEDKVVVVTGGFGYFGSAMTEGLRQSGAKVVAADIVDGGKGAADSGQDERLYAVYCDVSSTVSVRDMFRAAKSRWGKIDVLINNAFYGAGFALDDSVWSMTDEVWSRGMDGTAGASFRCIREAVPYFEDNGGGCIVNIASMYGLVAPDPRNYAGLDFGSPLNYSAGKAAVLQLTRYCAAYLAGRNVRVNSITPGPFPHPAKQSGEPQFVQRLAERTMLGRIGEQHELTGAAVFLASDASSYMTGANVVVDGGWTAW